MRLVTLMVGIAVWTAAGLAAPTPAGAEEGPAPSPEGLWRGVIAYDPGRVEIDVVVELGQGPDGRWAGTIDVLPLGIEYHVLEDVSVEGSRVTFWLNRQSPTCTSASRFRRSAGLTPSSWPRRSARFWKAPGRTRQEPRSSSSRASCRESRAAPGAARSRCGRTPRPGRSA